ncbi:MAG: phage portal protein [Clostridium perfringens]|nr:phage portal protein [Clostridium perfringens]
MRWFGSIRDRYKNKTESIGTNPTIKEINDFFGLDLSNINPAELASSTYYSCMLIRCNAIAKLGIKVMKRQEDEEGSKVAYEHSLYKLLKLRPNPYISSHDFLWATEFQRLEYGNAFWVYTVDVKGKIDALYLLDSTRVKIMVDNTRILNSRNAVYYIYKDPKNGDIVYTNDEIVHFKNFAMSGIKGTSVKKYLIDTINNEKYSNAVLKDKYENGLQDPIIVQYIGDLNEAKQAKIQKKFASLGGAKNAGKVVPIPTDFKVDQLETKLVNSQFFQIQGLTTKRIANAFGVKGFQLNDMEKSTYNNIEQQNRAFYSDTLQNPLTAYEQEIDYKLFFEEEKDVYYSKFNIDSMLRSDIETRYNAYSKAIGDGWKTRAEIRKLEGLPFEEYTDILTVANGACIPLKDLGKQYNKNGGE